MCENMNKIYIDGTTAKIKNLNNEEVSFIIDDPILGTVLNNTIDKDGEVFMIVTKSSHEIYLYLESGARIKIPSNIANEIAMKSMYLNVNQKILNSNVNLEPIVDPMDEYEQQENEGDEIPF